MSTQLIIQIPCYNEAAQIADCLRALPTRVPGFDRVVTLVVDDGSRDGTAAAAEAAGANHVLKLQHVGLAHAFRLGVEHAFLNLGADVLVNYDADREHLADDIPALIQPLLSGQADYTLGQRPIRDIPHFSPLKKFLQWLGSRFVTFLCECPIPDATTGFRAMNREAGIRLSVWTHYTYTLETLMHAVDSGLRIQSVPIHINPNGAHRPSRVVSSSLQYCWDSFKAVLITVVRYRPFNTFLGCSVAALSVSAALGIRFVWFATHGGSGRTQSLVICSIFAVAGLSFFLASILGEGISLNRRLIEQLRYEHRRTLLDPGSRPR